MFTWMFNCREVNRMISASMDSELSLAQRILIRFHLMMCRRCSQVRKQLFSLRDYARHLNSDDSAAGDWLKLAPETRVQIKAMLQKAQLKMPDRDLNPDLKTES